MTMFDESSSRVRRLLRAATPVTLPNRRSSPSSHHTPATRGRPGTTRVLCLTRLSLLLAVALVALAVHGAPSISAQPGSGTTGAGSLDQRFGTDGTVTTLWTIGGTARDSRINDVAMQPDGKIVAVGYVRNGSNKDFAIARYNADGSLDSSFGSGGLVRTDISGDDEAHAVAIQSDGKIVVAGNAYLSGLYAFAAARYRPNGELDISFSANGKATHNFGATDVANDVVIQTINNQEYILLAGQAGNGFGLVRYTPQGTLDGGFGTILDNVRRSGSMTVEWPTDSLRVNQAAVNAVAIDSNNKIMLAGYRTNDNNTSPARSDDDDHRDLALMRLTTAGDPDGTFGTNGRVTTNILGRDAASSEDVVKAMALQPSNGKIVVVGTADNQYFVGRYNTGGALDGEFGEEKPSGQGRMGLAGGGIGTSGTDSFAEDVAIQSDGRILIAGHDGSEIGLVRRNANGTVDTGFGDGGLKNARYLTDRASQAVAMTLDDSERIIVAGHVGKVYAGDPERFALARFRSQSPSRDATLKSLTLAASLDNRNSFFGTDDLNPLFSPGTFSYDIDVTSDVTHLRVIPTANDAHIQRMTVRVTGGTAEAHSSGAAYEVTGVADGKQVTVVVTSQHGNTETYTLTMAVRTVTTTTEPVGNDGEPPEGPEPWNIQASPGDGTLTVTWNVSSRDGHGDSEIWHVLRWSQKFGVWDNPRDPRAVGKNDGLSVDPGVTTYTITGLKNDVGAGVFIRSMVGHRNNMSERDGNSSKWVRAKGVHTTPGAPKVTAGIDDISNLRAGTSKRISLSGVFTDGDGDPLTLSASSSDTDVVTVTAQLDPKTGSATAITVRGVSPGTATITVPADDTAGNRVSDMFDVTVPEHGGL